MLLQEYTQLAANFFLPRFKSHIDIPQFRNIILKDPLYPVHSYARSLIKTRFGDIYIENAEIDLQFLNPQSASNHTHRDIRPRPHTLLILDHNTGEYLSDFCDRHQSRSTTMPEELQQRKVTSASTRVLHFVRVFVTITRQVMMAIVTTQQHRFGVVWPSRVQ